MTLRMRKAHKNQVLEILKSVTYQQHVQIDRNSTFRSFDFIVTDCILVVLLHWIMEGSRILPESFWWTRAMPNHQELLHWFWGSLLPSLYRDASSLSYCSGPRATKELIGNEVKPRGGLLEVILPCWSNCKEPGWLNQSSFVGVLSKSQLWNDHQNCQLNPSHQATLCRSPDAGTSNRFRPLIA